MQPAVNLAKKLKFNNKNAAVLIVLFVLVAVCLNLTLSSRGSTQANLEVPANPETCGCPTQEPCEGNSCVSDDMSCFTCAQVKAACATEYLTKLAQRCGCS